MSDTKVVILAAGRGTRMKAEVPKPLVKIAGKPMVVHLLERVEQAGIDSKPVVVVAPDTLELFKQELGDRVDYAVQERQLGTGDATKAAREACGEASHVLILYGDHPFIGAQIIHKLTDLARKHLDALVMLTSTVPNFENEYAGFNAWSRIIRDADGKIVGDRQFKDATPEILEIKELNPCIFVFPAAWLWTSLEKLDNKNANGEFYLTDLVMMAMEDKKEIVSETVDTMEVIGINTQDELKRAENAYMKTV
jgi:bifunctional UDP-N-acetylglucosamine pyrophosphorylase/glucosamine-1-phosphate N-acetyltransferase